LVLDSVQAPPLRQGWAAHSFTSVSHRPPVKPALQAQTNRPSGAAAASAAQAAPLRQGDEAHSSASTHALWLAPTAGA